MKNGVIESAHSKTPQQLLQHFKCDPVTGLTARQVADNRSQYGYNELPADPPTPFLTLVLSQFDDLLVKILLVAAVVDLGIALINGETGISAFIEPAVILLILVANATVGVVTESNAESAITALKALEADTAKCIRNSELQSIPVREVVPGDVVELAVGDKVPADAYVMSILTTQLRVDQSIMTGESGSVGKVAGAMDLPEHAVAQDKHNIVFSGSMICVGRARAIVIGTGSSSALGRIKDGLVDDTPSMTPLRRNLNAFGELLSKIIAVICIAVWVINIPRFGDKMHNSWFEGAIYYFEIAVALAVAAIPEGLPAVVTTCLALGTRRMAKCNAIVRTLPSVETLGCTTVICVDKTGTLTTNAMTVAQVAVPSAAGFNIMHVQGTPMGTNGQIYQEHSRQSLSKPASSPGLTSAALCAAVCNNAVIRVNPADPTKYLSIGESMEAALCVFAERVGLESEAVGSQTLCSEHWRTERPRVAELEFDRERKMQSVLCTGPPGMSHMLIVKGAPEQVLKRCAYAIDDEGEATIQMSHQRLAAAERLLGGWGSDTSLRCLALAYKAMPDGQENISKDDEKDLVLVGLLGLQDPPRPEAAGAVARCEAAGIRVIMLTGDNISTAEAVATQVGIVGRDTEVSGLLAAADFDDMPRCLTGGDFMSMSADEQSAATHRLAVLARVEPHHKRQLVEMLQKEGEVVAMTGDGVNDAPALKRADIGIAMGSGTAVAREASDMVLRDDNFSTITAAVAEGRCIFANTKQFIRYMVSSNIGEVVAIFVAALAGLPQILTPVQLLWVNLVTDGLPATALSFNPADSDVMRQMPRRKDEGIVDRWMLIRYMIIGVYVGAATCGGSVWWYTAYADGPTMSWQELRNQDQCPAEVVIGPKSTRADVLCEAFANHHASTVAMSVLVVVEMFNALNSLSENLSLFAHPPWRNLWLLGGILMSMLLHVSILYIPFLARVFGVVGMSWGEWRAVLLLSMPVVLIDECLKIVSRQLQRPGKYHGGKMQ